MHPTLKPKQADDPHDFLLVAPDEVRVAPADDELSDLLHQAARYRSDMQPLAAPEAAADPPVPPVDTTFRATAVDDILLPGHRWSMGRRALRAFTASLLAACIGVAAIAWQASGDTAKQMIAKWVPQLVLTSLLPLEKPGLPAQPTPPAVRADAANAAALQPAPPAQGAPQGAASIATDPPDGSAQLLHSMEHDLATATQEIEQLKASIEQLKVSQQQMSRDLARASEQNLRPGISAPPLRPAVARVRKPMPAYRPAQAAVAPISPPTAAPYYAPRPPEAPPQAAVGPPADPELSSVPRPPMPVR
jgi:hypothetical protein